MWLTILLSDYIIYHMTQREVFEYNNEEEAEIAQIQALFSNQNAIDSVQAELALQRSKPSLAECEDCGEDIPKARQTMIPGVTRCVHCQQLWERRRAGY